MQISLMLGNRCASKSLGYEVLWSRFVTYEIFKLITVEPLPVKTEIGKLKVPVLKKSTVRLRHTEE
jgi:hypothetical protein